MTATEKFVITHVFKNVSSMKDGTGQCSPTEEYFGIPWCIAVKRKEDYLGLHLCCLQEKLGNDWSIEVWIEGKIRTLNGRTHSKSITNIFKSTDKGNGWGWSKFIKWEDLLKDYAVEDILTVDFHVKIKKMTGIKLRNFDESTKQFSDVVLVVEDQKFYVSKLYLASHSPYFEALFLRDFKESTLAEIPLKDVNAKDFQNFLELLHGECPIDDSTIDGILHLADMYGAKQAIRKCLKFLVENSEKSLRKKLQLANRYKLKKLRDHCILKIG